MLRVMSLSKNLVLVILFGFCLSGVEIPVTEAASGDTNDSPKAPSSIEQAVHFDNPILLDSLASSEFKEWLLHYYPDAIYYRPAFTGDVNGDGIDEAIYSFGYFPPEPALSNESSSFLEAGAYVAICGGNLYKKSANPANPPCYLSKIFAKLARTGTFEIINANEREWRDRPPAPCLEFRKKSSNRVILNFYQEFGNLSSVFFYDDKSKEFLECHLQAD